MFNRIKYLWLIIFVVSCQNTKSVIEVPSEINNLFDNYNRAWSDGNVNEIVNNVYSVPFILYLADNVLVLNTENDIRDFLTNTFAQLEENEYGHSTFNRWEHVKVNEGVALVEQNFTRYLKDGSVMGASERTASYILRKHDDSGYKIFALIPHTPVSE